ncbi:hypothetical protein Pcinc_018109 [Petrolisthes cinctipes]|uniref:SF4 helicase domain-containing protein n=1 Tax=Petrolisthes cinctipes TaxID=88211 RepID=A0AAE1FN03_PETCI|nr:hypothetical protein Pcinc_018109 [Petrolisthes cinctipes]
MHTKSPHRDIPSYLQGNISKVSIAEDDLFDDELLEDLYKDMADDILEYLTPRLISYEETDTSFVIPCPHCSATDPDTSNQDIFIDKNTGYFVCPWCSRDGSWEDLMALVNVHEDVLTHSQLHSYLASTLPLTHLPDTALDQLPLAGVSQRTLKKFGARVTSDESRIVLPVSDLGGQVVGFHSVSLLHPIPQIIQRYVEGQSTAFSQCGMSSGGQIIFVPTCCDVLVLAEHNINAISLPANSSVCIEDTCYPLGSHSHSEVLLWYRGEPPPRHLLMSLVSAGIQSSIVQSSENDSPIHRKSLSEIRAALKQTVPVVSEFTTTFQQLKDKLYHRITHKEETCGVQWKRFTELNDILLGHRRGEMTVLTGPTGSGKTTLMAEYSLDLCCQGVKTLWGSFEVSVLRLCEVMLQQYTGAPLPHDLTEFNTIAAQFSTLPLHFLTYHGQQDMASVLKVMSEAVEVWGVEHIIIDNLQFMLGTTDNPTDRWWEQDRAVSTFRRFASTRNCHITLIAHPKKVPEGQPLSIGSVYGGAKVTQEADNVLILQTKEGSTVANSRKQLQVVKNRYGGQLGMVPLKFHQESLTLSSCFRQKTKTKASQAPDQLEDDTKKSHSLRKLRVKGLSYLEH